MKLRCAAAYGRAMVITGEVHVSKCVGVVPSLNAFSMVRNWWLGQGT